MIRFIDQAALEVYKKRELPKLRDEVHRFFRFDLRLFVGDCARLDADCDRCPAPRFTFAAVRGASIQEIPESPRQSVSEFYRPRFGPIPQTLKSIPNRFNQTVVSYDASKEEKVGPLEKKSLGTE